MLQFNISLGSVFNITLWQRCAYGQLRFKAWKTLKITAFDPTNMAGDSGRC